MIACLLLQHSSRATVAVYTSVTTQPPPPPPSHNLPLPTFDVATSPRYLRRANFRQGIPFRNGVTDSVARRGVVATRHITVRRRKYCTLGHRSGLAKVIEWQRRAHKAATRYMGFCGV